MKPRIHAAREGETPVEPHLKRFSPDRVFYFEHRKRALLRAIFLVRLFNDISVIITRENLFTPMNIYHPLRWSNCVI